MGMKKCENCSEFQVLLQDNKNGHQTNPPRGWISAALGREGCAAAAQQTGRGAEGGARPPRGAAPGSLDLDFGVAVVEGKFLSWEGEGSVIFPLLFL